LQIAQYVLEIEPVIVSCVKPRYRI